jgi:hypothetical protein
MSPVNKVGVVSVDGYGFTKQCNAVQISIRFHDRRSYRERKAMYDHRRVHILAIVCNVNAASAEAVAPYAHVKLTEEDERQREKEYTCTCAVESHGNLGVRRGVGGC